jgi:outer membrane receptor protein involved in Fe transport
MLLVQLAHGQSTGKIVGMVTESETGNVLPGVNVIIEGTTLGSASDLEGYYVILNVPIGEYNVQAMMVGYKTVTKTQVVVSLDQNSNVNFELEESIIEGETVVVVAERDILHREVTNSQQVVQAAQLVEAAGVRTINEFLATQAGITDERLLTVRGGSAEQTGTFVNGLGFVNPRIGKAEATIPLSAIEQISLQTSGFNAEYGNFRSGILNFTTKSGDKNDYHITVDYSRNIPHMKRFGSSLYDPTNYGLQPYMDPIVGFLGTGDGWLEYAGGNQEEADYLEQQHETFRGWNDLVGRYNRNRPVEEQATAMDLYLWNAWMHMAVPDFEKLEELYPEYNITEAQKQALRDHAHTPEGENADWNLDFGFGGPLPIIGKSLGDLTFFLSHQTTSSDYIQPVMRDGERVSSTMLSLSSKLSNTMTLKLHGIYRTIKGSQTTFPTDGTIPDLEGGGDTMPVNNLDVFVDNLPSGSREIYYWHPTFWQPKNQTTLITGFTLNDIITPQTFWDLSVSYVYHQDLFEPNQTRDRTPLINFGPIWVDEMPYGVIFGPDTVFYDPDDPTKYYAHSEFEEPYGLSRRYSSKVGQYHENSTTEQFRIKFDFSSQLNKSNFVKTGVEFSYIDMNNNNWRWWQSHDTIYEMRDRRKPYQLGVYLQDQISLQELEARIGVRVDYYNSGGGVWPTGDPYNVDAFTRGTEGDDPDQLQSDLESGKTVIWDRWRQIDEEMGGTFLEETKNFLTISPRLGLAFPVTERSKFYFNYGHFRSPTPYSEQFMYKMRFFKQGLFALGNPNLEPPRTISYEAGVAYNLLDEYLIDLSFYYKDVTGESADIRYTNLDGTVVYDSHLNNRWENNLGLELRVSKTHGRYLTGWVNFWYVLDHNGNVGRENGYQDPALNGNDDALYAGDENQATLRPKISANVSLHTPQDLGYALGDWHLSVLPIWQKGGLFTHNPASIRNLENNLEWPDYWMVNMKLAKSFDFDIIRATVYLNVNNVFNFKVSWMSQGWTFRNDQDEQNYLNSLHLPMYASSEYDDLRNAPGNEGLFIPGDDEVGDLRSADKPYINDPDNKMFLYGYPRNIWFGVRVNF